MHTVCHCSETMLSKALTPTSPSTFSERTVRFGESVLKQKKNVPSFYNNQNNSKLISYHLFTKVIYLPVKRKSQLSKNVHFLCLPNMSLHLRNILFPQCVLTLFQNVPSFQTVPTSQKYARRLTCPNFPKTARI